MKKKKRQIYLYNEFVNNWSFSIDTDSTKKYKLQKDLEPDETYLYFSTNPEFTPNADESNFYNITFHSNQQIISVVENYTNN